MTELYIPCSKDMVMFIRERDLNYSNAILHGGVKSRPCCMEDIYKTNSIYKVRVTPEFTAAVKDYAMSKGVTYLTVLDLPGVLGIRDKIVLYSSESMHTFWTMKWGFAEDFPIYFGLASEFEKLPRTKKQQSLIDEKNKKEAHVTMVNLSVKDNLIEILKKKGFLLNKCYGMESYSFSTKESYNKFVEEALQYYLNHIVNENNLGCNIKIRPTKKNYTRCWANPFIDLELITLPFDGDNNDN